MRALKPQGWQVLVGADLTAVRAVSLPPDEASFFESRFAAMVDVNRVVGLDPAFGRRLGAVLRAAGLSAVMAEGAVEEWNAEHPLAQLYTLTFQRLKARALDQGGITRRS